MPSLTSGRTASPALRDVVDPEIPAVNILDMGMVGDIRIDAAGAAVVEIAAHLFRLPCPADHRQATCRERFRASPACDRSR